MARIFFPLLVCVVLLGDGLVYGLWTNRWQPSNQLPAAVASLQRVPLELGPWQGRALPPLDERIMKQAGFAGYVQRRYENREAGTGVNLLLACGPFGPLSVHTPDVCFPAGGLLQQLSTASHNESLAALGTTAQCWKAKFGKADSLASGNVQVYWTWNPGNGWQAPTNPRWTFAGSPVLYKLYVTCEIQGDGDALAQETCSAFLQKLLPELEKNLVLKP